MIWRCYFFGYGQVDEEEELMIEEEEFSDCLVRNFIRIFITEVKLTFIYIIAALVSTYTFNTAPITRMKAK